VKEIGDIMRMYAAKQEREQEEEKKKREVAVEEERQMAQKLKSSANMEGMTLILND
jgi:hypothetical protein